MLKMDMKMALDLGDVGSVHVQNEANFRLRLGIPDGKYDLNLIFPPGSEKAPFLKVGATTLFGNAIRSNLPSY